ncbi:MAG: Tm-1-like ATP-binding domain-containing protein [Planctomycetaceae bacterium]|nr:Tm-1-like ATP-binding domain-containing protein [Planctomycetaceae bacterium]
MATIAVLGTFDSKGAEHQFLADQIRLRGHEPLLIDVGTGGPPSIAPHCSRFDVASAAGLDLPPVLQRADRGECVSAMAAAAPVFVRQLVESGRIAGIVTLGGSSGTAIGSAAMRALPIGFPKLIVSTMASGNVAHYVGTKDITIMPSIVDVAGLNRISRAIFIRAAGAICGMVEAAATEQQSSGRPLIVASMFGNTTKCVNAAIPLLEQAGYEVLVFHANGSGGRTMESLIDSGMVAGVLDITTTELADELVGGVLTAGPDRVTAAARCGVPAIVTPGCLDMVNFGERSSVAAQFAHRNFYIHNPQVTLMRTTPDECRQLGRMLAEKVNQSTAPVTFLIPRRAISIISAAGGAFHDAEADKALFEAIRETLRPDIPVRELDCEINDAEFAAACVDALLTNIVACSHR